MQTESKSEPEVDQVNRPSQKRRKLLKAALTAPPVAATLHSGVAAATSAYQCANPAPTAAEKTIRTVGTDTYNGYNALPGDFWARKPVVIQKYCKIGISSTECINATPANGNSRYYYQSGGSTWRFDFTDPSNPSTSEGSFVSVVGPDSNYELKNDPITVYSVVYFDVTTDPNSTPPNGVTDLGFGAEYVHPAGPNSNMALHGTCLCSLAGVTCPD